MGLVGFILGLLGLFINPLAIPSILGIIFSAIGLKKEELKGFSIAGLVISIIGSIYTISVLIGLFSALI